MSNDKNRKNIFRDGDSPESVMDYLNRAAAASESGDPLLGMYLYLAAYEEDMNAGDVPTEATVNGLKEAWALACGNKERQLAEYIFEQLEPYLDPEEIEMCAEALHGLAMDKLEEFGLSRDDLEGMAHIVQSIDVPIKVPTLAKREEEKQTSFSDPSEKLDFKKIAGYERAVKTMHDLGIGMQNDENFQELVKMLNTMHGLKSMPALDTILFRSSAREDANRFLRATLGELDMPTVYMHMEENYQGFPMLCVAAQSVDLPRSASLDDVFKAGGVLVLEDLDMWVSPVSNVEDPGAFLMMQLTRGAREAVGLIRSAVENPDVYVLVTASSEEPIDEFFLELLEPMSLIDIDLPTPEERLEIWMDILRQHPSLRGINRADLVRLSANMPRYDIYMAAREAIEDAYRTGIMMRRFQTVTRDNLFDKLAAYQPLDSDEYGELENAVIRDFQSDLNHIDDILRDS